MEQASRRHPLLAVLHWLVAAPIVGALLIGRFWLGRMSNANPHNIAVL